MRLNLVLALAAILSFVAVAAASSQQYADGLARRPISHPETPVQFSPEAFVSQSARARVARWHAELRDQADPAILKLIRQITPEKAELHALMLSGEHTDSMQFTRRSDSLRETYGLQHAVDWVHQRVRNFGFNCFQHTYRADYAPNLICQLNGTRNPDELVILGAHLDDIPANGRAPGANDDGSGSSSLLSIAQAIYNSRARFQKTLVLEWYTGEEQGLVGSRAWARERRVRGDKVLAMIQQDMVALRLAGDPVATSFVQDRRSVDGEFTAYVERVSRLYANTGFTVMTQPLSGSTCCSDSMSYHEQGFVAANYIEIRGYTGDPNYHLVTDVVKRTDYDVKQIADTAQVALATACELAGFIP